MNNKIAISKFKAHCLEIIEKLQTTQQPIIITKRDKPLAKIMPFNINKPSLFGMLRDKAEIKGNIVDSLNEEWDVEHE